jgi:ABC-type Co2+ transport system permease subunit
LRAGLTDRAWRDLIVALCLASVVAYFVNDTGVAAAAPAFLYAMAALTFPTMTAALAVPARAAP